jgi:hypothetical protein
VPGRRAAGVQELDLAPVVVEQRREAPADAEVDPRAVVLRVDPVHVVALLVGDHLEGQLVVVAQEGRPLAPSGIAGVCFRMSTIGKRSSICTP